MTKCCDAHKICMRQLEFLLYNTHLIILENKRKTYKSEQEKNARADKLQDVSLCTGK